MSQVIRWGVLGASAIARDKVLPGILKTTNARVDLLGTRDPAGRRAVAEQFSVSRGAASLETVVADSQIDAVYVSLPNTLHHEWIIRALQAGKPVLTDKPMSVTTAEAEDIAACSKAVGLPVMEGFMYRFHPQHQYILGRIADGSIGQVREVQASFIYLMLQAVSPQDIRLTDGPGAGALMDMGCYTVNAVRLMLGAEPVAVSGWQVRHKRLGFNLAGVAALAFPEGRRAQISWGYDTGNGGNVKVIGSEAILETVNPFVPDQGYPAETTVTELGHGGRVTTHHFGPVDQFQLEFAEFSAALLEGRPPRWTVADAVAQAKAMDLVKTLPVIDQQG
ncbi:MAG: Gfo/Idh/MocA family oxidoreductase [Bifidobacteriaceae bacterium]|jgi:predicted dehydrogenase|nr:Gfo/Idh/MocA family oxidoreductase [Bifidobacteriaceae bacterium]